MTICEVQTLDEKKLLHKYLNQANHNLFCYSKNYAMTEPKEGYEKEWNFAKREIEILEEMIETLDQIKKIADENLSHQRIRK